MERHLVFRGFQEDDTPQVTICNGDEIIAVYNDSEIDAPTFIKIMEEVGYITKDEVTEAMKKVQELKPISCV